MNSHRVGSWVITTFDSSIEDPREYLKVDYGGLRLHIKPGQGDKVNVASVFVEAPERVAEVHRVVNQFLSAMAWKDGEQYVTLGSIGRPARWSERDKPPFNYSEGRVLRYRVISSFDFEHLQSPPDPRQRLALALYREGLNSNLLPLYSFLSFYKIINIRFEKPVDQMKWINANIGKVRESLASEGTGDLSNTALDVGKYMYVQGRTAIAHAYAEPILDPDEPLDVRMAKTNCETMKALAELLIEDELGVPSLRKIWNAHLYELEGFKHILGEPLTSKLKAGESVALNQFPALPPLTLGLTVGFREGLRYEGLDSLPFRVVSCVQGAVILETDSTIQPIRACLVLNFPAERLEFVLPRFGINGKLKTVPIEIGWWRFLIDYYSNGRLEIFNSVMGDRLSHLLAFLPINIDPSATISGWERRIALLQSQLDEASK